MFRDQYVSGAPVVLLYSSKAFFSIHEIKKEEIGESRASYWEWGQMDKSSIDRILALMGS